MKVLIPLSLIGMACVAHGERGPWTLDLESGLTSTRYNSAQVPKSTGTEVDVARLVGKEWRTFGRISLIYQDRSGGSWKILYAPFRQSGNGSLGAATSFAGQNFAPGDAEATYRFDSYRLTYRKPWKGGWSVGGTLKIRDAEIRLRQGATVASESNTGFVPLLHVYGEGKLAAGFDYEVELDGLAGGPGRAIDLSLRVKRQLGPGTTGFLGYRVLEGGADVPRVKNFAWVNYITAGLIFRL